MANIKINDLSCSLTKVESIDIPTNGNSFIIGGLYQTWNFDEWWRFQRNPGWLSPLGPINSNPEWMVDLT
jgi:hypothetical protein